MNASNDLRVFISSTFSDLQEEREHLVKKIFPEIRALCRTRGITFTEVDLRWGLTEEQATLGTIVRTCLEEVDKCRPYFIGMLGDRYGWSPDLHEVLIDPELLARFPWVEDAVVDGTSLTEMEFMHGVFGADYQNEDFAYFYHRPHPSVNSDNPAKLEHLIQRVRDGNYPLREFGDSEQLGLLVRDDLRRAIDLHWPEDSAPTAIELERRAHSAFAASRRRAYIPNPSHLKEFSHWISEGTTPLVISARSGVGKSALAAYLCERYRAKNPQGLIIEHYVGASEQSGSATSLARRLIHEICDRFAIRDQPPSDPRKLLEDIAGWLWRLGHRAAEEGLPVLIVLDALNHLDADGQRLSWLPSTLPENLKLIVTATPGDALDNLRARNWEWLELAPIEDARVRQSIVLRYLGEFHKGISPEQVRRITDDPKASYPLYLRVVAEELRLHGEHESLGRLIDQFASAEDLADVFQQMLERIEADFGGGYVREVLTLIWATRAGLAETDLLLLTGMSRLELSSLLFALDYHLLQKNGLLGFFHDYLRRAVEKRYLSRQEVRDERYRKLADYFEGEEVSLRATMEMVQSLEMLSDMERLRSVLSDPERFAELWVFEQQEVLRLWSGTEPSAVNDAYRTGQERWLMKERSGQEQFDVQFRIAELLFRLGAWADSENWYRSCEEIAREIEDPSGIARAVGNLGIVHWSVGRHEAALSCFAEQEEIAQRIGDRESMASAIGSRGNIHWSQGQFARALACYQQQEVLARELGDQGRVSLAIGNLGLAHWNLGHVDRAMACYLEQESIARSLGDSRSLVLAVGNIANVHLHRQERSEALGRYLEQEKIALELGDRQNHGIAQGNRGLIHEAREDYREALLCFQLAVREHREMGFRYGLTYWLEGIARVLMVLSTSGEEIPEYVTPYIQRAHGRTTEFTSGVRTDALEAARAYADECVAISDDISKPDTQRRGRLLLCHIDIAIGDTTAARSRLLGLLDSAADDSERATCHYWLWKWKLDDTPHHQREAIRLFESLPPNQLSHESRQHFDEVTGRVQQGDGS